MSLLKLPEADSKPNTLPTELCWPALHNRVKIIALLISRLNALPHVSHSLHINFPASNPPENSPDLGVSILSSEPSPLADEIRGRSTSHTGLTPHLRTHPTLVRVSSQVSHHLVMGHSTSHRGLVPILHLAQYFHPSMIFARTRDRTRVTCIATLHYGAHMHMDPHWELTLPWEASWVVFHIE